LHRRGGAPDRPRLRPPRPLREPLALRLARRVDQRRAFPARPAAVHARHGHRVGRDHLRRLQQRQHPPDRTGMRRARHRQPREQLARDHGSARVQGIGGRRVADDVVGRRTADAQLGMVGAVPQLRRGPVAGGGDVHRRVRVRAGGPRDGGHDPRGGDVAGQGARPRPREPDLGTVLADLPAGQGPGHVPRLGLLPHPSLHEDRLLMAIPTVSSAVISDGTLSIAWSENVTYLTGSPTLVCTDRLHSITSITFSSEDAPDRITQFEFAGGSIFEGETVTLTVPAGLVESQSGGQTNAAASGLATTNNSDHTDAAACDGVAAGLMVNRCMILRPTESQSASSGAISTTWSVWKYPVCCNIQAAGTSEGFAQAKEDDDANYNAFFP